MYVFQAASAQGLENKMLWPIGNSRDMHSYTKRFSSGWILYLVGVVQVQFYRQKARARKQGKSKAWGASVVRQGASKTTLDSDNVSFC